MNLGSRGEARLHGIDFEEFVARMIEICIRLGTPDRRSLRERGYSDAQIDLGTAELLARGFLVRTKDEDIWGVVPPRESIPHYLEIVEHRAALARAAISELDSQWRRAVGRGTLAALPDLDLLSSVPEVVERIVGMHRSAQQRCGGPSTPRWRPASCWPGPPRTGPCWPSRRGWTYARCWTPRC